MQEKISKLGGGILLQLLDQYFSRINVANSVYRIQNLELDLGAISYENFELEFTERLNLALKHQLAQSHEQQQHPLTSESEFMAEKKLQHDGLELVIYFAQKGYFPWWADTKRKDSLDLALDVLLREDYNILRREFSRIENNSHAIHRLIDCYSNDQLQQLCDSLNQAAQSPFSVTISEISSIFLTLLPDIGTPQPSRQLVRRTVWFSALKISISVVRVKTEPFRIFEEILFSAGRALSIPLAVLQTQWLEISNRHDKPILDYSGLLRNLQNNPYDSKVIDQLSEALSDSDTPNYFRREVLLILGKMYLKPSSSNDDSHRIINIVRKLSGKFNQEYLSIDFPAVLKDLKNSDSIDCIERATEFFQGLLETPPRIEQQLPEASKSTLETVEDEICIENSGLVILWPFLESFFQQLNWLDEKRFRTEGTQLKAVVALQYLATNVVSTQEFFLPLNKLLCGLELNAVVGGMWDVGGGLSRPEKEACKALLAAVIDNASVLKNTSQDGFRASFLLRDGIIAQRDGAWLLRVERQTHDIMLDRFPWSFEWFKLPWMPKPMRVEW